MSILVITTITGTFNARAIPKCSLCVGKSSASFRDAMLHTCSFQ